MKKILDFRILNNPSSLGLINAIVGYCDRERDVTVIIDKQWMRGVLCKYGIKDSRIVNVTRCSVYRYVLNSTIILPMQRLKLDVWILSVFGLLDYHAIVHDLHFRSNRKLLKREFVGILCIFKKMLYNYTIRTSKVIYVNSELVRRQVKKVYSISAICLMPRRIFSEGDAIDHSGVLLRDIDYYIPLSRRIYKGFWKLQDIVLSKQDSIVAVSNGFAVEAGEAIRKRNPKVKMLEVDTASDRSLISIYKRSKYVVCLSRYEGFGFTPYEAEYFGAIPLVLNCSSYLKCPQRGFVKMKLSHVIEVPYEIAHAVDISDQFNDDFVVKCAKSNDCRIEDMQNCQQSSCK